MQNRTVAPASSTVIFDLEKRIEAYFKSHEWHRLVRPHLGGTFFMPLWRENLVEGGLSKDGFVEREPNKIPGKRDITRVVSTRKAVENSLNGGIRVRSLEKRGLVEVIQDWVVLEIPSTARVKVINHRTGEINDRAKQLKLRFPSRPSTGNGSRAQGRASMEITGLSAS